MSAIGWVMIANSSNCLISPVWLASVEEKRQFYIRNFTFHICIYDILLHKDVESSFFLRLFTATQVQNIPYDPMQVMADFPSLIYILLYFLLLIYILLRQLPSRQYEVSAFILSHLVLIIYVYCVMTDIMHSNN